MRSNGRPPYRAALLSLPHRCARLALLRQFVEHGLEILGLAEIAVDRGEAHIGDVVERAQRLHHHLAHRLGGDFALALALESESQGESEVSSEAVGEMET